MVPLGCVAALLVAVLVLAFNQRDQAFTLGVQAIDAVGAMEPGDRICQGPIGLGAEFDAVEFRVGTHLQKGTELTVRAIARGKPIARGVLPPGYEDNSWHRVKLSQRVTSDPFDLCVYNTGKRAAVLYGGPPLAAPNSILKVKRKEVPADVSLVFFGEERSLLGSVGDMLERASRFNLATTTWLWLLLGGVVIGVPVLLTGAFKSSQPTE